jgi:hypothetical protein
MENKEGKPTGPQLGAWASLPAEEHERVPRVEFEINIPKVIKFKIDGPREYSGERGAYYIFDCTEDGQDKVLITSAWTLLKALKILGNLNGKSVKITKKMIKGKQSFEVVQA